MITKDYGTISFVYDTDELFDAACLISSYITKSLISEQGGAADGFVMSDDERELFDVCVKKTVPNIFESMLKMTTAENSFSDNNTIAFTIDDNNSYNENAVLLVDNTISECLKFGVLSEFYSICVNPDIQRISNEKYMESILLLNQRLFQLKKKPISSLY